jgi:hypothetical protein
MSKDILVVTTGKMLPAIYSKWSGMQLKTLNRALLTTKNSLAQNVKFQGWKTLA